MSVGEAIIKDKGTVVKIYHIKFFVSKKMKTRPPGSEGGKNYLLY
jgi:hypothetical protein